ncbi:MAG: type II toxin-antitoxin system RelE/ParE family toxin [Gracilimonas sp.]
MEVIWTNQALNKVNKFVDYIAQDSLEIAEKWAEELLSKTDQLHSQPMSGRIVPEYNEKNLREIISGNYRIIYRIKQDTIYIQTVRHVRQNLSDSEKL